MVYFSANLPSQVKMASNDSCLNAKPVLSFSIERILHGHFKTERERLKKSRVQRIGSNGMSIPKFNWLEYTRYNPPKLPSEYCDVRHSVRLLYYCMGRLDYS